LHYEGVNELVGRGANCPPQLRRAAAQRRVVLFNKINRLTNTTPATIY
jgi:hypothetical protein